MKLPFPAEHDQQQAEALETLRESEAFVLVNFSDNEEGCDHPFCAVAHSHRTTKLIASCGAQDLEHAMRAIAEELQITTSIEVLMNLGPEQREAVAALLRREEGAFFRLRDDEA